MIKDLKVGDKVIMYGNCGKMTVTTIECIDESYDDIKITGYNRWFDRNGNILDDKRTDVCIPFLMEYNEKLEKMIKEQEIKDKAMELLHDNMNYKTMTIEKAKRIIKVLGNNNG